jgi:hypothetical protein
MNCILSVRVKKEEQEEGQSAAKPISIANFDS